LKVFYYILFFCSTINVYGQDSIKANSIDVTNTIDTTSAIDSIILSVPYAISDSILNLIDTVAATAEWQESPPSVYAAQAAGRIIANPARKNPQWLFIIFVLQLLVLIYVKATGFKNLEDSLKAYFNTNLSQQLFREQESAISFSVLLQMMNFIISCSVLLYLFVDYFFQPNPADSIKIGVIIFVFTAVIYLLKYAGYKAISYVFPFSEHIDLFRFNYFLNQKLLGMLLIPFIYAAAYSPVPYNYYFLYLSAIIFFSTILVRSTKGLVIGSAYLRKHTFHFLLYICTFEIAPVLILVKWLQLTGYGQN
jgi:hypothetical protein